MAEQYIKITRKNKKGEEKTNEYRVDAEFVPKELGQICEEFIQNYCLANGQVEWLDKQYAETETFMVKKQKERKYKGKVYKQGEKYEVPKSFMSIRRDFGEKFFGIEIKGSSKKKTGRELWEEKKKAKK